MPLRLYQRPGSRIWYIRGTVRGQRVFETAGTADEDQADALRSKREAELFEQSVFGPRAVVSFKRAALSYLEFEARSIRTKAHVARLIDHFGAARLASIDQSAADKATMAIVGTDAAPATKRRAVYVPLTAILMHAADRKWCVKPSLKAPKQPKGKTQCMTPAQAVALIDAAAPHLKPLLVFLFCVGARLSEALELDWTQVDLPAAKVLLRDTKNGTDRPARLPTAAVIALGSLPHREGAVFRRDDGEPYADRERQDGGQIKRAWSTACRRAGIPGELREVNRRYRWTPRTARAGTRYAGRAGEPQIKVVQTQQFTPAFTPHDCRHSWASWFYALTKDFMLLKDEGGWKTLAMVERYAHLMPSDLVTQIRLVWGDTHPRVGLLPGSAKSVQSQAVG